MVATDTLYVLHATVIYFTEAQSLPPRITATASGPQTYSQEKPFKAQIVWRLSNVTLELNSASSQLWELSTTSLPKALVSSSVE